MAFSTDSELAGRTRGSPAIRPATSAHVPERRPAPRQRCR